ncbi:Cytochrome P450 3A56 [Orchesella cincta]|uniref:Cytochrome P450 3A56 n=1 Tax=Orchesella cincta TaxID=48709 RepID=A0A1D2N0Y4_ORCCI|nr:Cytochrome P450 3A56 [Orchesella cincta]
MWLLILLYALLAIFLIILGLITYARWNFGTLEKTGIPVVKPDHFLLGSAMLTYEKPGGLADVELMKKYGPVFGLYEGREPQVFICDADLIRSITVKDADYFDSKRPLDFGDPIMNEMLDFQPKEKWRIMRNMFTPVVNSSVRLRNSNPAMNAAIADFISDIKGKIKESGNDKAEKFSLNENIYAMLTDLIARSQFSVTIGKSDMNNRMVKIIKDLMTPPAVEEPALASWTYAFPFIKKFLPNTMVNPEPVKEFAAVIKLLMETRRKQGRQPDELKNMVDFCIEWFDNLDDPEWKKNDITENTIWFLGLISFMAGQDQISLILSVMMLYVSKDPELEERIHEEIDQVYSKTNGKIDHDVLSEFPLLTACIHEAARLYPFFFRTERVCTKDWQDKERGIQIKKGTVVQISIWGTSRNPEYFEDPEEFQPERFLPKNKDKLHPYAYTSFGHGPRKCLGIKYAMEMMLLLTVQIMKEFKFVRRNDTQLNFLPCGPFFGAHEPIYFDVVARNKKNEE